MSNKETNDSGETEPESVIDRPRAALTRTDREYLLGEKNYDSDQAERNAQYRIRQHLKHSMTDFGIVALADDNLLEDAMRKQAENPPEFPIDMIPREANHPVSTFSRLTSRLMQARAADEGIPFEARLEDLMELGIESSIHDDDEDIVTDVSVDISIETEIPAESSVEIEDIIYGETTRTEFDLYIRKVDNPYRNLRERLQKERQTIDFAEDADRDSIGPDDPILELGEGFEQFAQQDE